MKSLKNIIGICCGTEIFFKLSKNSLKRVLFDIFVLTFILSILTTIIQTYSLSKDIKFVENRLKNVFGRIIIDNASIYPEKNSEESITVSFNNFNLYYNPTIDNISSDILSDKSIRGGLIWRPKNILFWSRYYKDEVVIVNNILSQEHQELSYVKASKFSTYFKSIKDEGFEEIQKNFPSILPFEFSAFIFFAIIIFFIYAVISTLLIVFLYTFILGVFSYIFTSSKIISLKKCKEFFVLNLYIGVPGMIIATLFESFNLPFFDYSTIYFIALLIYIFPVMHKLYPLSNDKKTK